MLATAIQSVGVEFSRNVRRIRTELERMLLAEPADQHAESTVLEGSEDLSTAERVLRAVTEGGGRIEQATIVEGLDLSPATVSRTLTNLEADGRVVRYRVGRGKLVCLPECVPEAAKPPRRG